MLTGPDRRATPLGRGPRTLIAGTSAVAVIAFLAATLAVLFGSHAASTSATRTAGHSVGTQKPAGIQPSSVRVTAPDRADSPQHRVLPWSPVSVAPQNVELTRPAELAELRNRSLPAWRPYHSTPAQGRSPPH